MSPYINNPPPCAGPAVAKPGRHISEDNDDDDVKPFNIRCDVPSVSYETDIFATFAPWSVDDELVPGRLFIINNMMDKPCPIDPYYTYHTPEVILNWKPPYELKTVLLLCEKQWMRDLKAAGFDDSRTRARDFANFMKLKNRKNEPWRSA
ncbi:hypothetical protein VTH82DRAFT_1463 [Thermothelomyces myriococcoides]